MNEQTITLISLTPEKFTEYLTQAVEKGKEIEREKGMEIPYISEKEVISRFGYTKTELDKRVKEKVFRRFKDGNKKVFYQINDILNHIKENEVYGAK